MRFVALRLDLLLLCAMRASLLSRRTQGLIKEWVKTYSYQLVDFELDTMMRRELLGRAQFRGDFRFSECLTSDSGRVL